MRAFDFHPRTRVVFGEEALERLPELVRELPGRRVLVVSDPGVVATGQVDRARALLGNGGAESFLFDDFGANPDTEMVERGRVHAASFNIDSILAMGGGSSLDCAKGINFVLTNGGTMRDYWGHGKASKPLLPMIGVPMTAGTGSEAQSYALISDAATHVKMACGDPKASFRIAVLDPVLTVTQPPAVTAATGYDAISHAVETFVTTRRTDMSELFSRGAWQHLERHYQRVLMSPTDLPARAEMMLGAYQAGAAVEQSMLGATHACANPLTARYGTVHGDAIAIMLPHVVRWNAVVVGDRYGELAAMAGLNGGGPLAERLASRLEELARAGGLPRSLSDIGATRAELPALAEAAARQWTGTFNPRPFDANAALELYAMAFD